MLWGYSFGELGSILVMQGFAGLILFSVFVLMALGLAIIFGQMGVINMAHGEFMILGAYMTYLCAQAFQKFLPSAFGIYFFVAMCVAFIVSGALGLLVEWALIRHLYKRPLDTLLATWGLSLIMQQAFRSIFGPREVGVELPSWMMGSLPLTDSIDVQINGLFVMGLTLLITAIVALLMYRSRWGLQVRAVVANRIMSGAVGIDTRRIDRLTFGLGCGIAGVAESAFTMIGSTGPTAGQLYIVDTFLVVVFGGAQSLLGTIASALAISQSQSTLEFFLTGSMAKVLTLLFVIGILMLRPQGLFVLKVRRYSMSSEKMFGRNTETFGFLAIAALILVILPLALDIFRLNLIGKYLTYSFVAIGLVLCWGYTGILSLGQGVFFGLGGYCMAMFLKLEASSKANTAIQSTPGIPDFMDWIQMTELPFFWVPFKSLPLALIAVVAVPVTAAFILSFAMFRRRVGDVYFAIITQALAAVLTILIVGRQGYTGGINGITDLRTLLGWDIRTDSAKYILYFACCFILLATMLFARFVLGSKLGRILVAVRDKEDRVRFTGYDVASVKIFVFCLAAAIAALGGALFTLQVGFMSPSFVGIVPSIEMVIFCAVGGRHSVIGAVVGTLVINWGKTLFSESFPELWLFAMGSLFIAVVLAFPRGLAGLFTDQLVPLFFKRVLPALRRQSQAHFPTATVK